MNKNIRIILSIVCLGVFCFSLIKIINYFKERSEAKNLYNDIISQAVTVEQENTASQSEGEESLVVDFELLKQEYKDITGWIYSPDTQINYPVVKSKDNAEYLKTMPNGKYNASGSIFVDCRNGEFGQDRNYIIYGHNMKNDSMFGSLSEYKKQSFYENHSVIYYTTPERKYELQLFAGFVTSAASESYIIDHTEQSLKEYMQSAKEKSTFKSSVQYNTGDNILTLSTCSSDYKDARYVLIAIVR